MKAMVLLTDALGGYGGIAKFNRDLLQALSADGRFDRILALPRLRPGREAESPPRRVDYRTPFQQSRWLYGLSTVYQSLRSRPLNLLLCGHIHLLPVARLCARLAGARLALVVHGIEAWKSPGPRFADWMQSVDMVLSVSQFTADQLISWSGIARETCRRLPNVIDLDKFSPGPAPPDLLQRWALENRRVLLTVGRLDSREQTKGFDETIEVLARLRERIPELVYLIVGEGDDQPRLQAKAVRLGVSDRVIFSGYVSDEEKVACYRLADVYVMPSRSEGFGIVYLEALACGLPVIGGRQGGGIEVLAGMEQAIAVPPGNLAVLEGSIIEMLGRKRGIVPPRLQDYTRRRFQQRLGTHLDLLLGARYTAAP